MASSGDNEPSNPLNRTTSISFADPPARGEKAKALYIPSPRERDQGRGIEEVDYEGSEITLERAQTSESQSTTSGKIRQRRVIQQQQHSTSMSISRVAPCLL
jgi:hypothetical protein